MATKAQLKEYFKSQKIPTEAQFGTFIDSTQISFSDVEVEWNGIKDNLDNVSLDVIMEFRNQWYKQANK